MKNTSEKPAKVPHNSVGSDYDNQVPPPSEEKDKDDEIDKRYKPFVSILCCMYFVVTGVLLQ